jgi:hypothetical protein
VGGLVADPIEVGRSAEGGDVPRACPAVSPKFAQIGGGWVVGPGLEIGESSFLAERRATLILAQGSVVATVPRLTIRKANPQKKLPPATACPHVSPRLRSVLALSKLQTVNI